MRKLFKTLAVVILAAMLAGCNSTKRVIYNFKNEEAIKTVLADGLIRIKPNDRLTVVVSSQNPELAAPFNAASSFSSMTSNPLGTSSVNGLQSVQVLTVDDKGMLEMPIIGKIDCNGKTRAEIANEIAKKIIDGGYISDAQVNIQFADMKFFVLGEVQRPGQFDITRDKVTVLEALAMAGDMTIYGNRENVTVIRRTKDEKKHEIYELNFLEGDQLSSPAYYLQQGDVVYVQPNKYKAATAEINQNRTFWISIASTLITATSLVLTIVNFAKKN
ncbi:MAG: polysaccharide biosynthesis/export family protein [Alistipes sp.]|nr:polysaccharide biosynthesis/export family protein [Alistipes sp.]MBR0338937.1 polysaccharide biosynthesis/export family protein [Alistipes sp.]